MIFNIEENEGENGNTESLVRNVLREKMKIPKEEEECICFEHIHRITPGRSSSKPRPIIVKFSHYQDKEFVWSFVKNLKGTNFGIAHEIIMSHGSSNSCGVAVLMKKAVEVIVHSKIMDPQRCFIILKVEFNENLYVLINVYAPNKDNDSVKFLEALRTTL